MSQDATWRNKIKLRQAILSLVWAEPGKKGEQMSLTVGGLLFDSPWAMGDPSPWAMGDQSPSTGVQGEGE